MTDTLFCPFCKEFAKFQRLLTESTQQFRCTVCEKPFAVDGKDVAEKPRTQVYDMPKHDGNDNKKVIKIGKKR